MYNTILIFLLAFVYPSKSGNVDFAPQEELPEEKLPELIANSFDFPVGPPDGKGYYNAQGFRKNNHLGDDWNGLGGGDSDLGDPIYNIGNGEVIIAMDNGYGWGNVIIIRHYLSDGSQIESLYAHCDTMMVKAGEWINKGHQIGTIGNANGVYPAHLHFELRDSVGMSIGGGYSSNTQGFVDPTRFIRAHR
jgi:murein DD-endopeptidase MepM/ murein hydrolase activator NlpD